MKFDWTINAGHVLTAGAMVASVALGYGNLKQDGALLDLRLSVLERGFAAMADQNTRIAVIERVISDLPDKLDTMAVTLRRIEGNQP